MKKMQWRGQAQDGRTAAVFEGDLGLGQAAVLVCVLEVVGLKPTEGRPAKGCWRWISVYQTLSS